ncbi:MAG: Asp-tRNA(Asn)/Glu-tRNA(Gln) amidotransferase subunit GatC [Bdellovibrionota bacterium]
MTDVNETLTRKVAALANLELTDPEVSEFTVQIAQILAYVDSLQAVNCEASLEPLLQISNPAHAYEPRPDEAHPERGETGFHPGAYQVPAIL